MDGAAWVHTQAALHTYAQLVALTTGYTDAFRAAAAVAVVAAVVAAAVRSRGTTRKGS